MKRLFLALALTGGTSAALANCVVYEHRDFKGARLPIESGLRVKMILPPEIGCTTNGHGGPGDCDNNAYEPGWNDRISSYRVTSRCTLKMWEHVGARGWELTRTGNLAYIGNRRNDEVSEALCTCR